ncbi:MAG: glycosyltransferase family 2 protein [Elusimicrobia bacterium]|nr:glycosyltransferase family 2 protein [Elusimicrobiota bacterium]
MEEKLKIIAVLPAYNAEKTLERTLNDIPKGSVDEVILVDDASRDRTVELAKRFGLHVVRHDRNKGYGGNQKTCYGEALKRGADIVVMIHPDYQYDPRLTPYLVGLIRDGVCDVVLGSRIRTRREALDGGMPPYKYFANRFLTILENLVTGQNLGEWHTGMRAYSRKVLEQIRWEENSDDFVFDQQILIQVAFSGFRIGDIPVPARYFAEASSINFRRSVVYGLSILWLLLRFQLHRIKISRYSILLPKHG